MTRAALIAMAAAALLAASGCSSTNRIVGHNLTQTGHWYGELGITGDANNFTVQSGSRITKLSIMGDGNTITVQERCSLGKIEICGENNTVNIPDYLVVRIAQWGSENQIVRRGMGAAGPRPQLAADRAAETFEQPVHTEAAPAARPVGKPSEEPAEPDQPAADESEESSE
jgi:hypothetical protein